MFCQFIFRSVVAKRQAPGQLCVDQLLVALKADRKLKAAVLELAIGETNNDAAYQRGQRAPMAAALFPLTRFFAARCDGFSEEVRCCQRVRMERLDEGRSCAASPRSRLRCALHVSVSTIISLLASSGLWPNCAMLNHSCVPNCCYGFLGNLLIVRTAQDIGADEELTISYVSSQDAIEERDAKLMVSALAPEAH